MQNNQLLRVKNSLLELKKDFMEMKDIELKDRKVFKDDMDKFEEHEMKKIRPIIRNWFDWLIKQSVMREKPKIIIVNETKIINEIWRLFNTEQEKGDRKKQQNEKIIKGNTIRDIRILFEQEKEEGSYEPKRVSNFWNNNIEHESNGDENRSLSFDEYRNKIESYLSNIIISLQNSDT